TYTVGDLTTSGGAVIPRRRLQLFQMLPLKHGQRCIADALSPLTYGTVEASKDRNSVLWVEIAVPAAAAPGVYSGAVDFYAGDRRVDTVPFALEIEPSRLQAEGQMELNVWQSWSAVAKYHDLEPFSQQWWKTVDAYLRLLGGIGQDVVQVGRQYVTFRRVAEGEYQFDFSNFDRYVRLCADVGIDGPIEYLAMMNTAGPTSVFFRDETGALVSIDAEPGDEMYDEVWLAFLRLLVRHCEKQGWKGRLRIFIADRPQQQHADRFMHAASLVQRTDESLRTGATFDDAAVAESLQSSVDRMVVPLYASDPRMATFIEQSIAQGAAPGCYFHETGAGSGDIAEKTMYDVATDASNRGFSGLLLSNFARWPDDLAQTADGYESAAKMNALVYPSDTGPRSSVQLQRLMLGLQTAVARHSSGSQKK
ncbi:MAG: glycoside hydrolase domain-containing protein, partial [Armatimonadota bacterium]